jgi:hypothetical protein
MCGNPCNGAGLRQCAANNSVGFVIAITESAAQICLLCGFCRILRDTPQKIVAKTNGV